jgi:hypothetical protein
MMGLGKTAQKVLLGVFTGPESFLIRKQKVDAKNEARRDRKKLGAEKERERVLEEKRLRVAGGTVGSARGIGGTGTLLTGSGGLTDPAITGKQTLLGAQ